MDNANLIVLYSAQYINKLMPLWHYGILLSEAVEDCSLLSMLNIKSDELKQILELYGLIPIK